MARKVRKRLISDQSHQGKGLRRKRRWSIGDLLFKGSMLFLVAYVVLLLSGIVYLHYGNVIRAYTVELFKQ